jgi:hypothetical protein
LPACCEEILKEKKGSLSCHTLLFGFFNSYSGTHASPPVFLDIEDDDPVDPLAVQENMLPP